MFSSISGLKLTKNPYKAGCDHMYPESGCIIGNPSDKNKTDGEGGLSFQHRKYVFVCLELVKEAGRGWCPPLVGGRT